MKELFVLIADRKMLVTDILSTISGMFFNLILYTVIFDQRFVSTFQE